MMVNLEKLAELQALYLQVKEIFPAAPPPPPPTIGLLQSYDGRERKRKAPRACSEDS
ncbi:hypothetical protein LguiB_001283 [Lonicera macranthoides]